jgi:hypothetical protein
MRFLAKIKISFEFDGKSEFIKNDCFLFPHPALLSGGEGIQPLSQCHFGLSLRPLGA